MVSKPLYIAAAAETANGSVIWPSRRQPAASCAGEATGVTQLGAWSAMVFPNGEPRGTAARETP